MKFWLLANPPVMFFEYTGSQLTTQLPCLSPGGSALNQITANATLQFAGAPATYSAQASAVFTCLTGGDASVTIPLDIVQNSGAVGGTNVGVAIGGSQCSSTATLLGDSALGVCPASSCDANSAAFQFSNTCTGLDGASPTYWACGAPADWTLIGPLARAQLAVPYVDGAYTLGLLAFPLQTLTSPDPTLTDANGTRLVFGTVATPFATLTVQGGVAQPPQLDATRTAAHVALLAVPPSATTQPQAVLEIDDAPDGSSAVVWNQFGPCDVPAAGVPSWPGFHAIDVRLSGLSTAAVLLSPDVNGVASAQALCAAGVSASGAAIVTCTGPAALGATP
jgi:hypothetical protein